MFSSCFLWGKAAGHIPAWARLGGHLWCATPQHTCPTRLASSRLWPWDEDALVAPGHLTFTQEFCTGSHPDCVNWFFPNFCKKAHKWKLPAIWLPPLHTWIKYHRFCIYLIMICDFCCHRIRGTDRNLLGQRKEIQLGSVPKKTQESWVPTGPTVPAATLKPTEWVCY